MSSPGVKVRSANLLDVGRVEELYRVGDGQISETSPPVRLWTLVSHTFSALLPLTQESLIYVAEEGGRVAGFVQASVHHASALTLSGATALQVLNLVVAADVDQEEIAPPLIEHLCNQALDRGVHRLFVRLPTDDSLTPVFRMQGFRQYATETVLYAEAPKPATSEAPAGLRPFRGRDARQLYQLYRKVTPLGVAQVEAPTYKDWRLLGEGGAQFVVDQVELVAWMRFQKASEPHPHALSFLALPDERLQDGLIDQGLALAGPGAVWSSLRHYDAHMIDALRGAVSRPCSRRHCSSKNSQSECPSARRGWFLPLDDARTSL